MNVAQILPLAVVIFATSCAAVTDIRRFKIYHAVTVPLLLSGMAFRLSDGWVAGPLRQSRRGVFRIGFLAGFLLARRNGCRRRQADGGRGRVAGNATHVLRLAGRVTGGRGLCPRPNRAQHGVGETLVHLQLSWLRLAAIGRRMGVDSRVEDEVKRDDRHRRLIPFAAMILVGIVAALIWERIAHVAIEKPAGPEATSPKPAGPRWIVKVQTVLILVVALALGGAAVWLIAPL